MRTISLSLIYADLKTLIYADIFCESLREHSLRYLRELFFLADLRRFKNADLRWYFLRISARTISFSLIYADIFCKYLRGFFLRISARAFSAISARTISLSLIYADLKTQIYADIFCESLREHFLRYLREQFLSRWLHRF